MRAISQTVFLTIPALVFAATLSAQTVGWQPAGGQLGYGKTNRLSLVFDGCKPVDAFDLPSIDGLNVSPPSRSEQTNIVNFKISQRVELTYAVQPTRRGEIVIPALNINTTKGRLRTAEVRFEIVDAKVGQTNLNIDDIVTGIIQVPKGMFWKGQIIDVTYLLIGNAGFNVNISSEPEWSPTGLLAEPFGEPERINATIAGKERPGLRYRTRAMVRKTGVIEISDVRQRINIQTGERAGFFLSQPRAEEFLITSNRPAITARPLPTPPQGGFSGAVGQFKFESTVVPTAASIGDPITWTLHLEGKGNWPEGFSLPERVAAADLKVIQPQSRRQMVDDELFSGTLTEDVILVPTRPGTYDLGAAEFTFFNPDAGRYETITRASVSVVVTPLQSNISPDDTPELIDSASSNTERLIPETPPVFQDRTVALPRDPAVGKSNGIAPLGLPPLGWALIVCLPALAAWIWEILRRFRSDDPGRRAKAARRKLIAVTRSLAKARDPDDKRQLLGEWMRLGARALDMPVAVPSVSDIERHLRGPRQTAARSDWTSLWQAAETALYGHGTDLPPDWVTRAGSIVSKLRIQRRSVFSLFRKRYWLPSAILLLLLPPSGSLEGATALDHYREGAFARSEQIWRTEVAAAPLDASARNNLALALAQQDRWPEANAFWISAFALDPANPDHRWNLRVGLSHVPGMHPRLAALLEARGVAWVATRLSPGAWDRVRGIGAGIVALGIVLGIFGLFRRIRIALFIAPVAMITGTAGLAIGAISTYQYGVLAHPEAVVVQIDSVLQSIPTDVADAQQSRTLPAGEIATVEGDFLSWRKLRLDSGETGWVRKTVILPIYRAPPGDVPLMTNP